MLPDTLPFISRRSTVYGTHAMVSSSQPLATQAGIEILRRGGNAADAAVAVAAALNVTEPGSTGIGGDAFCLYYSAADRTVKGLNGSGRQNVFLWTLSRTPAALTIEHLREVSEIKGQNLPTNSAHAITVPGAAAAWVDTVKYFGSQKVDLQTILQPAIDLAENGYPVSEVAAYNWAAQEEGLRAANKGEVELLLDGHAPHHGDLMTMPSLAETFRSVAEHGKDGFYKGRIAEAMVDAVRSRGGLLTLEDLAAHESELIEPISLDYHGWTIWEIPPNGQGITTLIALGILNALEEQHGVNLAEMDPNSAEYLHLVIEALRLAFADTRYYVTDPQVQHVPVEALLNKKYLAERAALVDLKRRNDSIQKGYPEEMGNTVYFSVVDEEGNACSFINSTFMHFGSHIIPEKCGFTLHNRGCNFVLIEGHPNCIGPSKRPYHTIIPSMITRKTENGHELEACFGVMGAFMQPQGQVQVVLNLLHHLHSPQHALDVPRICVAPPKPSSQAGGDAYTFTDVTQSVVYMEEGISQETSDKLQSMGHTCYFVYGHNRSLFGRGQIIQARKDRRTGKRVLAAGSDPRGDGHASGW
ncbi:nucleophile aminohydrolase [Radiomyces spectabilis]|uniref:nucleophile aminohydrolase n=1 Tax=Radiomyces spectabilis TaxID=64574 RepID=UPI002220CA7F|nr:nucleophile aminohydrolase [Radiomyces spectabilis]KAI8391107.1 nucleophile aminohydrolase [Radiomyces spectabilis]